MGYGAAGKGRDRHENPINDIDNSLKVWVGNVPSTVDWKVLQAHFNEVGKTKWAEVLPKGVACVAYKSASDASSAISVLNGSTLAGQAIIVDTWSSKSEGGPKKPTSKSWTPVWKPHFIKLTWSKGKGKGKKKDNPLNSFDPSCKVWIGGLPEGVDWKQLQTHFNQVGDTKWVERFPKGDGCAAYKTPEEAANAIAILNGSVLGGEALTLDAWTAKS